MVVTDDTFIHAYLAKTIEAPELKQEVKQFIISSDGDYESILDKVFKDFRAQESSEYLCSRSGTARSISFAASRGAAKAAKPAASDKGDSKGSSPTPFPSNFVNAIPAHVYSQVTEWYPCAVRRNEQDKVWIKKMKWKHHDHSKSKKYLRAQEYRSRDQKKGRETEITVLLVGATAMSTSMIRKMIVLLTIGEAVIPIMTAVSCVPLVLVSVVVREVLPLRDLLQGVKQIGNLTRVTVPPVGLWLLCLRNDCCHINRSQLRYQFIGLNRWMIY